MMKWIGVTLPVVILAGGSVYGAENVPADRARGWETPPAVGSSAVVLKASRFVLAPPRLALKYFFVPFEHGVAWVGDKAIIERAVDILYNDARTAGVVPVADYRNELGFSAGAKAFHADLLGHREAITARADYGGEHFHSLAFEFESVQFSGAPVWVELHLRREAHPSLPFSGYGMRESGFSGGRAGPRGRTVDARYSERRQLAALRMGYGLLKRGRRINAGMSWIHTRNTFGGSRRRLSDHPSIEQAYDTGLLTGFRSGVSTHEITLDVEVNLANRRGHPSRGTALEAYVGGVPRQRDIGYLHYGAVTTTYLNLYRETRVLVLKGVFEAVERHRRGLIPFSALPRLGGARTLRGYKRGRFRDLTVAAGSVEYRYPVHENVLGQVYVDMGSTGVSVAELGKVWKAGYGFGFLIGAKDATNVKLDISYGDNFEFFLSFDPTRAFHDRTRRL